MCFHGRAGHLASGGLQPKLQPKMVAMPIPMVSMRGTKEPLVPPVVGRPCGSWGIWLRTTYRSGGPFRGAALAATSSQRESEIRLCLGDVSLHHTTHSDIVDG